MPLPVTALTKALRASVHRRRQKHVPRPRIPTRAERRYLGAMVSWAQMFELMVRTYVQEHYPDVFVRQDAVFGPIKAGIVRRSIGPVRVALNQRALQVPLQTVGNAVADHVTTEATRVIGLKASDVLPMGHTVEVWRQENVGLIKSLGSDMLDRVSGILEDY